MLKHFKIINNSLLQLKLNYKNGIIGKPEYIQKMHNFHSYLFDYAEFINKTDISKIEIDDNGVVMTLRKTGLKMLCDKNDCRVAPIEILNFDVYEDEEFSMAVKLIENDFNIMDIGANFGWYSLNFAKFFKSANIFAFEPIPKTYNYLKQNIQINNLSNIEIYNFGFSDKEKIAKFYYYPEQSGNASSVNLSHKDSITTIKCLVKTVDSFVKDKGLKIDFIKCDVEGAELFVFRGANNVIKRDKPIIYSEMLRKFSAQFNYSPNDIIKFFSHIGYRCFCVNGIKLSEITTVDEITLETNFFFLHSDNHRAKIRKFIKNGIKTSK